MLPALAAGAALLGAWMALPEIGPSLAAVGLAASVSGVVGFAFSGLCGPLLLPVVGDPVRAVAIMLAASIAIQGLMIWDLRRIIVPRAVLPPLLAGLATLPLGIHLLLTLPTETYRMVLGAVLLAWGGWMLTRPRQAAVPARFAARGLVLTGALGGLTGGLAAFPGAAIVIWCGLCGWPKDRQRALFQPYILAMQLGALGLLALMGQADGAAAMVADWSVLAHVPPALFGAFLGLRLFRRLSGRGFALLVNLALVAAGLGMLL
jgi:uncharacterized membrane protein YfcA